MQQISNINGVLVLPPLFYFRQFILSLPVLLRLDPQNVPIARDYCYETDYHFAHSALLVRECLVQLVLTANLHPNLVSLLA
jgi:hypothetical protein